MVPVNWLNADLDSAEKDGRIKLVVVLGHRNVVDTLSVHGDALIDAACAGQVVRILEGHPKVRAYVCAHVHAIDVSTVGTSGLRQIVVGNGGSKLEERWNPPGGRTFGFGYFKAYSDGSLGFVAYLRPAPANYLDSSPAMITPALPQAELIIPAR